MHEGIDNPRYVEQRVHAPSNEGHPGCAVCCINLQNLRDSCQWPQDARNVDCNIKRAQRHTARRIGLASPANLQMMSHFHTLQYTGKHGTSGIFCDLKVS